MPEDEALDELRTRLRAALELCEDAALRILREAVAAGERERPVLERRLTRARSAIMRALSALGDEGSDLEPD